VVITAGGDGTILRAARMAAPYSIPILGINMGRVGFMTELSVKEAAERIPAYLGGSPRVETRMMIQGSVVAALADAPRLVVFALNEFVLSRGMGAGLPDIEVTLGGEPLIAYRADGVIVATPTGSTGYALAAGGPVLYSEAKAILVQPVAAHMSLQSGLVVPDDSVLELGVTGGQQAVLSHDGITDAVLGVGDRVIVVASPHVARFLRAESPSAFYAHLARRLGAWSRPASTRDESVGG
jgi:NAD+ kinase